MSTELQGCDGLLWGTNQPGHRGERYGGRAHIVSHGSPATGLCGLPVTHHWEQRPPSGTFTAAASGLRLCPECCLLAMARMFPAVSSPRRR